MATTIRFIEGFDNTEVATDSMVLANGSYQPGYNSAYSLRLSVIGSQSTVFRITPVAPTLNTTWYVCSFYAKISGLFTGSYFQITTSSASGLHSTSVSRMCFYIDVFGRICVRRDGTSDAVSSTAPITANQWFHFEYRHRYGNATFGNYEVFVNGVSVLSGVGDNSGITSPRFLNLTGGTQTSDQTYWDHIVIGTSDDATPARLNFCEVQRYLPTSTSTNGWTGSDSDQTDNHLLVDDGLKASADYVQATAGTGLYDLYGHAAMGANRLPIAVQVRAAASADVVGTDDFSLAMRSGGSNSNSRQTLGQGSAWLRSDAFQTDPATGTAWTKAGFDAASFGVKS